MSRIQEAVSALGTLHDLTKGFGNGNAPNPHAVLGVLSNLCFLHLELGQEMSRKFSAREKAYLTRKIAQAQQHRHNRTELKKTVGESDHEALLAVGEEYGKEIDAMAEYESYRALMRSIENAIDFSRTTISFLRSAEKNA